MFIVNTDQAYVRNNENCKSNISFSYSYFLRPHCQKKQPARESSKWNKKEKHVQQADQVDAPFQLDIWWTVKT
jgi:hypothetical protein